MNVEVSSNSPHTLVPPLPPCGLANALQMGPVAYPLHTPLPSPPTLYLWKPHPFFKAVMTRMLWVASNRKL